MEMAKIVEEIKNARNIGVIPHVMADGDSLGASLALGLALEEMGKTLTVYLEEKIPGGYAFLPGQHLLKVYEEKADEHDLVIALDTGDLQRMGRRIDVFNKAPVTVNIDHHPTNTRFANYNHVDEWASSVGEMIYQLLRRMSLALNPDMALCLYTAIATDTGGFRFSNTTYITHQVTADLVNSGVNVSETSRLLFETIPLGKVRLMEKAIHSLRLYEGDQIAVMRLSDQDIADAGARDEECDGIVNIARNIKGVEVGVLLRQRSNGEIKVNLRSNTRVDVSGIARSMNGGGHKRAAGCTVNGVPDEIERKILTEVRKVL